MKFEIPLAEPSVKPHQITALHLFTALTFIIVAALSYVLYKNQSLGITVSNPVIAVTPAFALFTMTLYGCAGIGILAILMLKNRWALHKQPNKVIRSVELCLALLLLVYVLVLQIAVLIALSVILTLSLCYALYVENNREKPVHIIVSEAGICLPGLLRKRLITWQETEQVLLKHGTLTINGTNQYLYQWNYKSIAFDVAVFQEFCAVQIEAHKNKRVQD